EQVDEPRLHFADADGAGTLGIDEALLVRLPDRASALGGIARDLFEGGAGDPHFRPPLSTKRSHRNHRSPPTMMRAHEPTIACAGVRSLMSGDMALSPRNVNAAVAGLAGLDADASRPEHPRDAVALFLEPLRPELGLRDVADGRAQVVPILSVHLNPPS